MMNTAEPTSVEGTASVSKRKRLKAKLLMEFEIVWREIIDPFLGVHPLLSMHFSDGGYLSQELLGHSLYAILTNIRKQVIQNRKREQMAASSSDAGVSMTG